MIELVTCICVGAVISGISGALVWNAATLRTQGAARGEMTNSAAAALELVLRYCREIQQNECPANPTPCLLGNAQVSVATASEIRFGVYGFRLNGNNLEMTKDSATNWYIASKDVSAFTIAYSNRIGSALTSFPLSASDREDIRQVQVTLQLTRANQTAKVRSSLYLRSFMDEATTVP